MRVIINGKRLIITIESKNFHFDLSKNVDNNLKHEIDFVIKHKELLAEHSIKNEIRQLLSKYKHENDIQECGKQ